MKRLSILVALLILLALSATAASAGTQQSINGTAPVQTSSQPTMVQLAVGGWEHTCAVSTNGAVLCWGLNGYGEIGDGTTTPRSSPVYVPGLTGVTAIATGEYHTCAVINGGVKCWGRNSNGQLGNNSMTDSSAPVDVKMSDNTPLTGVTAIAAAGQHTCALASGVVMCWGYNHNGQLGNGGTTQSLTPIAVSGLSGVTVTAIAAGSSHTCALTSTGGVKCWGRGTEGQLGNNLSADSHTPVNVQRGSDDTAALSGVTAVDAGDNHTCAVVNGGAKCWGWGGNGQLGDNSTTSKNAPVDVNGLTSGVSGIAGGYAHTCALTTAGGVKCWGYNWEGQLGDGTTTQRTTPVAVSGLASGVSAVDTGHSHSCALTATGEVKCWGYNVYGQLGIGITDNGQHLAPVNVALFTTATVTSSANPAAPGQTIIFTATVDSGDSSQRPTGNVTFYDGGNWLGTGALNASAQATKSVTAAGIGDHSITAVYAGGLGFGPSSSPAFTQTIKLGTATTLSAPPHAGLGSSVVFTATVTVLAPGSSLPTGTVTFKDGTSAIAGCSTQALNNASKASCTLGGFSAGSHAITATYNGDASFVQSTSAALNLNVFHAYIPLITR